MGCAVRERAPVYKNIRQNSANETVYTSSRRNRVQTSITFMSNLEIVLFAHSPSLSFSLILP